MTNSEMIQKLETDGLSSVSDMDFITNALEENDKLKAEIEQLKEELKCESSENKWNQDKANKLWVENKQLKSELEQSVKLPYPIDTPIYFVFSKQGITKDRIRRWQINNKGLLFNSKGSAFQTDAIGKIIFLTKQEAELKLMELKGEKQ